MSDIAAKTPDSWVSYPPLRNALLAGSIALSAFVLDFLGLISANTSTWMYLLSIPIGGYLWAREGVEGFIENQQVGISVLMIFATAGAAYLNMWDEAAALVVLYAVAEGIEEYTFSKTRNAIRALLDLAPKEARVIRNGQELTIPAQSLKVGEKFIVLPGGSVPTDGIIIAGESSLDESSVTGESVPVDKQVGDQVFSATINGQATLTVEVSKEFSDNTLSRIIELVENAQQQKGRAQEWMERFGRRYSPMVLLVAFAMLLVPVFSPADAAYWIEKAVILLVAAAPCALIISLPITMAAGISGSASRGILIKGGAHLEHLGNIKTIAFDKTGTLTHGKPRVTDIQSLRSDDTALLRIAAALEQYSTHPLARAIVKHAQEQGIKIAAADDTRAIFGSGVKGSIDQQSWYLGSPKMFKDMGVDHGQLEITISELQSAGKTVVLLGNRSEISGLIALQDTVRDNAREVIGRLHGLGIKTVMLTGDNPRTAATVAEKLGIDSVRASLKPEDKVSAIEEFMRDGPTLMVGDGVNDAPALAMATCGVAMGAAGSDAAVEAADIALMADDLGKLEEAMRIGRKARQVSRQNIIFSIIVLAILIPAGVGGFMTIALTVLVHEASELLAVANGLRAGRYN